MNKDNLIITVLSLTGVGLGTLAIRAYGKMKYSEGRVSVAKELLVVVDRALDKMEKKESE